MKSIPLKINMVFTCFANILLLFNLHDIVAQPVHIESNSNPLYPHLRLTELGQDYSRITFDNNSGVNTFWTIAAEAQNGGTPRMNFYYKGPLGGADRFTVTGNGRVGIQETNPTANLHVNGTTKLGPDSPNIKIKRLTGTTASCKDCTVDVPHGISDRKKILGVHLFVDFDDETNPDFSRSFPAAFHKGGFNHWRHYFSVGPTSINVANNVSNSSQTSKPFRLLIIYED